LVVGDTRAGLSKLDVPFTFVVEVLQDHNHILHGFVLSVVKEGTSKSWVPTLNQLLGHGAAEGITSLSAFLDMLDNNGCLVFEFAKFLVVLVSQEGQLSNRI